MAKRSKSSGRWLQEHFHDRFVQKAQAAGWRSRAVFKLEEINQKHRLLKPGMTIVDLGAAPGGWSQYVMKLLDGHCTVIALDILDIDPIAGVDFIQGDFREDDVYAQLLETIGERKVDLVMSDMAPNMSGNRVIDQPRAMDLCELALELAQKVLRTNGDFLVKCFQGVGYQEYHQALRSDFKKVVSRKPDASRDRSTEMYLLGRGYNRPD